MALDRPIVRYANSGDDDAKFQTESVVCWAAATDNLAELTQGVSSGKLERDVEPIWNVMGGHA